MKKTHTAAVALIVGAAAVLGTLAATRTVGLGRTAVARPSVSRSTLAARAHRLDRIEVALRASLRKRPPKLPSVPKVHPPASVQVAGPAPVAAPQRVIYQRPSPIVIVKHRSHGDDHESGDGGDGEGGGGDG